MLNIQKGNMYGFITHTWNTIKGECFHDCSYCYMKRFKNQKPIRFDEKELNTDLGEGNFIFVGSSCDMFAKDIFEIWIEKTLKKCAIHSDNKYLFQSKNPFRFGRFDFPDNTTLCTTIESDIHYKSIMQNSPDPLERARAIHNLTYGKGMITIEPVLDFNFDRFVELLFFANPIQINIGADSGNNNLPEPSREKVLNLISALSEFTTVHQKPNLRRLLK